MWITRYTYPPGYSPPLWEKALAQQRRYPWHFGVGYTFRLPFTRKAVSIGRWTGKRPSVDDGDGPRLDMKVLEDWENYVRKND